MSKQSKIRNLLNTLPAHITKDAALTQFDHRYIAWFFYFNNGHYYEAHDVLEDLWLMEKGPHRHFYKALIQLAGVFVHLQKQQAEPEHPKHRSRLFPASRLLERALTYLEPYEPVCLGLDIVALREWMKSIENQLVQGDFKVNPLSISPHPNIQFTSNLICHV